MPSKLENCPGKNTAATFKGTNVSQGIAVCPSSSWTLIAANVINNCLIMCRKSHSTGEHSYVLLRSIKSIVIPAGTRDISVPSFVSAHQILTFACDIGMGVSNESSSTRTKVMHAKPVFSLIQSAEHPLKCCSSITPEFFLSLFGPEFDLCQAPVLLIGSQNGNIYFTNFICNVSRELEDSIMGPLYSLGQPVVGIHLAYFPPKKLTNDNDPLAVLWDLEEVPEERAHNGTPNAIVFVGQRGKISICHSNPGESKSFPNTIEFQVPAPLTSSILVPNSCLLFATLQGLYRICLRQQCAKCVEEKLPSLMSPPCNLRIPHVSFKFPEKIFDTACVGYVLKTRTSDSYFYTPESEDDPLQCSYVSMDGNIAKVELEVHNDKHTTSSSVGQSASIVGQEIKHCLQSIQVVGERISQVKKNISMLDSVLANFKGVLDLLCALGGACTGNCDMFQSYSPFNCSFLSVHEDVGTIAKKLYMDVTLTYNRPKTETSQLHHDELGTGWSFILTLSLHASGSGSSSSSKSVSMTGMVPGDSVCLRVDVEECGTPEGRSLVGSINCFIHFTPHYLCESVFGGASAFDVKTFKGVSLFLCSKTFTILDFYQPSKSMLLGGSMESLSIVHRKAVKQILSHEKSSSSSFSSSTAPSRQSSALLYSLNLPICLESAIRTILATSNSFTKEDLTKLDARSLGTKLICALIPTANNESYGSTRYQTSSKMFTSLDGSSVSFEVNNAEIPVALTEEGGRCSESLKLLIRSSCKCCLTQVVSAIHTVIAHDDVAIGPKSVKERDVLLPHARRQLCERLEEMQHLCKETRSLKEELHAASNGMEMNSETYGKKLHSLKLRAFSQFCKLRELS